MRSSISRSASTASTGPRIVTGRPVMTSAACRSSSRRRRHVTAQVAVGHHALEPALLVDDTGHAEPLARHLVDDVGHRRVRRARAADASPVCITLLDPHQALDRVVRRGAGWRSAPPGIPCGGPGPCASASPSASVAVVLAVGARFIGQASSGTRAVERDVGRLTQRRGRGAGQGDEPGADAADGFEQPNQFFGLAAVGERHDDVTGLDDPEVAVHGLGRVQEHGGRARAREASPTVLRAMMPDLPMPVTMTRPAQPCEQIQRRDRNAPSRLGIRPRIARASVSRTLRREGDGAVGAASWTRGMQTRHARLDDGVDA